MKTSEYIKQYADEDAKAAIEGFNKRKNKSATISDVSVSRLTDGKYEAVATATVDDNDFNLNWNYTIDDDGYVDSDLDTEQLYGCLSETAEAIESAIASSKTAITAADDDPDADLSEPADDDFIYDDGDDSVSDNLNDIADSVEDLQDSVEDIDEDDLQIDMDNNIADHYIAECDNCHGIFISSMIVSDQDVDSISGICPICDKDSTQYLKWKIVAVNGK